MTQSPATPPVCDARTTPLPCPFCGEPAIRMVDLSTDPKTHSYRCDNENCDVRPTTCQKTSALVAKNLWNTRALPDASPPPPTADEARTLAHNIAFRASELSREKLGPEARKASVMIENDLEPEECAYALAALLSRIPLS